MEFADDYLSKAVSPGNSNSRPAGESCCCNFAIDRVDRSLITHICKPGQVPVVFGDLVPLSSMLHHLERRVVFVLCYSQS